MDIICYSHLRWNFVFQRPQHLLSRFAIYHQVFFIEEPIFTDGIPSYDLHKDPEHPNVFIVVPRIQETDSGLQKQKTLASLLDQLIEKEKIYKHLAWYYSPMALNFSSHLNPEVVVYDCMDELSAFRFAPPELTQTEQLLMQRADVVFTGGRSLYEAKKGLHPKVFCFPSSIDKNHFQKARLGLVEPADQRNIPHPRIGFFGVIDERLDIRLLEEVATRNPKWQFILIGPVVKIDPESLPKRINIHYLGKREYKDLPAYISGWDIGMMPFAMNESTQYISPTKTPEYLAAGKPVISTPIADVVQDYGKRGLVDIVSNADEFQQAAYALLKGYAEIIQKADQFLKTMSWNQTWREMVEIIEHVKFEKTFTSKQKPVSYV